MTLAAALDDASAEIDGLSRRTTASGVEWLAGPTLFAALSGSTAEFRLDPVVAAAALGTADTAASARGADWVAFTPTEIDRFALDRAIAWFASAARRAARP